MTDYISILTEVQNQLNKNLLNQLEEKMSESRKNFFSTSAVVAIVVLICPPLSIWYAVQTKKLLNRIQIFMKVTIFFQISEI